MLGWAGTNLVASPPSTGNAIQKSRSFNLHPFPHWLSWELDLSTLADPGAAGQEGPEELKNPTAPTLHWAVGCTSPFPLGSSPWHYGLPPLGTPGYGTGQQATEEQQHRQRPGQSKCFAWRLGIFFAKRAATWRCIDRFRGPTGSPPRRWDVGNWGISAHWRSWRRGLGSACSGSGQSRPNSLSCRSARNARSTRQRTASQYYILGASDPIGRTQSARHPRTPPWSVVFDWFPWAPEIRSWRCYHPRPRGQAPWGCGFWWTNKAVWWENHQVGSPCQSAPLLSAKGHCLLVTTCPRPI